ncbi:hypothetical protein QR680_000266 [Steinernema hermaphroditum]|uniref:Ubiquitin-like domain-containing protein n=1 Tax=Steinernema hermaphroditum TaxID=289476 RepID=A0AA39GU12_9BILA|nr:hypothetical protein QR680_000266 [Steinernema hermaphroditum]
MSSSDEDEAFNVKALIRKQKKKARNEKRICEADDFSSGLDDILDDEVKLLNDRTKEDSDELDSSDGEDGKRLTVLERVRMKKNKKSEKTQELRKVFESLSSDFSSSDEDGKCGPRSGARHRKRRSELETASSSADSGTGESPLKKKASSSSLQEVHDDEDIVEIEGDEIMEVRYFIKDLSDNSIASFFFPANAKVNDITAKFKNKLDPTLPYLYFFTEDLDPIDPDKTPMELGWNLSQVQTVRIRQSSQIAFHLAQKQKAQEQTEKATRELEQAACVQDNWIQIKFQLKNCHKPFKVMVDPTETFRKIKTRFCKEHKLNTLRCFLIFDNERLADDSTPDDYEMERNDCVDVHVG